MNTLTNPRWLFLVNTLPMLIFSWLAYRQYTLIESLLKPEAHSAWLQFGIITGLFVAGVFATAVFLDTVRKRVNAPVLVGVAMAGFCYLYYGMWTMESLVPWDVPRWLGGEDLIMYLITFSMPTLGYGLLTGVHLASGPEADRAVWKNFLVAVLVPLGVFGIVTLCVPMFGMVSFGPFFDHFMAILIAGVTVVFLFFLVRGIYLLVRRRDPISDDYRLFWLIPLAIAAPLAGLALNQSMDNIFGKFTHPTWYLLAMLNGLLLCLPAYENKLYRLFLFLGRSVLGTYILYFFIVFLPFLPLSVGAILAFGGGFLMLTPLALLPVQANAILDDYRYLKQHFKSMFLGVLGAIAFLMIPLVITNIYLRDKTTLASALKYVYAPGEAPAETFAASIRPAALDRVLATIDTHKGRRNDFGFGSGTPYLSSYYRWLVLDNLTLSDAKMNDLQRIFQGESGFETGRFRRQNNNDVALTKTTVQTEWDPKQEAWSSWVDLELTRDTARFGRGEYRTEFELPPGVFIADYYLYVEDRKEYGILAEKRAATWVYNNIVNTNRDPGFLRYVTANRVAFNVFPFAAGETRRTGIRFLHKEPLTLPFDGRELALGRVGEHPVSGEIESPDGNTIYIPEADKTALAQVQRKLGVHFVVDASRQSPATEEALVARIGAFASTLPAGSPAPRITLAGTYPVTVDYDQDWWAELQGMPPGGFFAQRAVENILNHQLAYPSDTDYQVVLALNEAVLPVFTSDFSAYTAALPEGDDFYYLEIDGTLSLHLLTDHPERHLEKSVGLAAPSPVLAYPNAESPLFYLPATPGPVLLTNPASADIDYTELPANTWSSGLALRGEYLAHQRTGATGYRPWLEEVRGSFHAELLMPTTGFLVVENEAQEEALRRKQAETLRADPNLDLEEDQIQRMSEPGWVWMIGLLVLGIAAVHRNR